MSVNNIEQVLAQMRTMAAQASGEPAREVTGDSINFSSLLKQSIDSVNETQVESSNMKQAFETGDQDVNLAEVMVAVQKSSLSFEAMLQVRNKVVSAYEDIMRMQV